MNDTMTISEMSAAFDVTARTLRFYEAKELLFPIRQGQKRFFTKACRARLKLILRGKKFGFELEEMRQLLNLYDKDAKTQHAQMSATYKAAEIRLAALEDEYNALQLTIDDMRNEMRWCAATMRAKYPVLTQQAA